MKETEKMVNLKTIKNGKLVDRELTEHEKIILESVDSGIDYVTEDITVTLGDFIEDFSEYIAVDPMLGQRDASEEVDDETFNAGILKGTSSRNLIQLSTLEHRLVGLQSQYDNAEVEKNDDMMKFYRRRIDRCDYHLSKGEIYHLDDGQNRQNQYVSVFSPDSTKPIKLKDDWFWEYTAIDVTGEEYQITCNVRNKSMVDLPPQIRAKILLGTALVQITSTTDDLLLSEFFQYANNGTRASKYSRIGQLARSVFKSQLEQLTLDCKTSNYKFNYQSATVEDPKTEIPVKEWTYVQFLEGRWFAGSRPDALYGSGSFGWQNLLMNGIIHSMGNDLNSDHSSNRNGPFQDTIPFGTTGFDKGENILIDSVAGMSRNDFNTVADFQEGSAIAVDAFSICKGLKYDDKKKVYRLEFTKSFRHALGVNTWFLYGHVRNNSTKYVKDWGRLLKLYITFDEEKYEKTKHAIWQPEDARGNNPLCSDNDVGEPRWKIDPKTGKPKYKKMDDNVKVLDYETQTTGFYYWSLDQTNTDNLNQRKKIIGDWFDENISVLLDNDIIGEIPVRNFSLSTLEKYWNMQSGKCGYSQKDIDPDLLSTKHVDINYDDYKEGLLHLIGESQRTIALDDFFGIKV
jgi:hypothetical protein